MDIFIGDLDKAEVLVRLYGAAKQQGMGFMHGPPPTMTTGDAKALLTQGTYFDYVHGRVMKVDLKGDTFCTALYDRDNGQGAAQAALAGLTKS